MAKRRSHTPKARHGRIGGKAMRGHHGGVVHTTMESVFGGRHKGRGKGRR